MEATIRIERYADQGRCVGHIDGRVVFVRFALPGELVRVELDEPHDREERFWTGESWKCWRPAKTVPNRYGHWQGPLPWAEGLAAPIWCM